ncbi:hypothetical protein [Longimicrobium sp.]|uniref:hypothetical protein n=1 Tax=Longimicrobium sp. TaxID=2029185 RepID=UPI002E36783C|nr:hypothetical protein [Longimicrobium sp.]HEX6039353.1 hypothetical protein [Longimicrobium sp.]
MRMLIAALSVLLLAACADPAGGNGSAAAPVLVNRTATAFVYAAFDLADAGLVDPNPAIDPAMVPERVVAAGAEAEIQVEQTSGEGVLLFLYEIPAGDHAGPVSLSRTVRVTRAELIASGGRIVIDPA